MGKVVYLRTSSDPTLKISWKDRPVPLAGVGILGAWCDRPAAAMSPTSLLLRETVGDVRESRGRQKHKTETEDEEPGLCRNAVITD